MPKTMSRHLACEKLAMKATMDVQVVREHLAAACHEETDAVLYEMMKQIAHLTALCKARSFKLAGEVESHYV